jgi:hypothetical protein
MIKSSHVHSEEVLKFKNTIFVFVLTLLGSHALAADDIILKEISVPSDKVQYVIPAAIVAFIQPYGRFSEADKDLLKLKQIYGSGVLRATRYRMVGDVQDGILPRRIGVQAELVPEGIKVGYIGARPNGGSLHHNYYATFGTKVIHNGQDIVLDVICPEVMIEDQSNGFMRGWDPFISVELAVSDLGKICHETRLRFLKRESGEVNVNFSESAVMANFARKLKTARKEGYEGHTLDGVVNAEKYRWFTVQDGSTPRQLAVTIDPYRTGSKVTYIWTNVTECKANAGCNYDADAAKRMDDTVSAIAND